MEVDQYFAHTREEIADLLIGVGPVLDVGCGAGMTCSALSRHVRVVGIEPDASAAGVARRRYAEVVVGTFEDFASEERFAQIVLADVLEHMVDPWGALRRVTEELLLPEGRVVMSMPNVRYWQVLVDLIFRDRWTYQRAGILDRTHLRFFTRTEIVALVQDAGLRLRTITPKFPRRWYGWLNRLSRDRLRGILAYQWLVVAERESF